MKAIRYIGGVLEIIGFGLAMGLAVIFVGALVANSNSEFVRNFDLISINGKSVQVPK